MNGIVIIAGVSVYGPFLDQETAQGWLDGHKVGPGTPEFYAMREAELGTVERADECGTRLQGIDEATKHSRKAGSAG